MQCLSHFRYPINKYTLMNEWRTRQKSEQVPKELNRTALWKLKVNAVTAGVSLSIDLAETSTDPAICPEHQMLTLVVQKPHVPTPGITGNLTALPIHCAPVVLPDVPAHIPHRTFSPSPLTTLCLPSKTYFWIPRLHISSL